MNQDNEKILDIFRQTGALMEGHFILRSGLHSGHFFQCARVCEHMDRVTELKNRFIFAEKENNKLVLRRNFKIANGEKILIVEDVITRGGRVQECIDIVKEHGGVPAAVAVLVDRSDGKAKFEVPCKSLLEFSFPTYEPDNLPPQLAQIPATHPGS